MMPTKSGKSDDSFEVLVDVNHFGDYTPEEVVIKIVGDNWIEIQGTQTWRNHPGGQMRRLFEQRLYIPPQYNLVKLKGHMTSSGKLTIRAPKLTPSELLRRVVLGSDRTVQCSPLHLTSCTSPPSPPSNLRSPSKGSYYSQNGAAHRSPKSVTLGGVTEIPYK